MDYAFEYPQGAQMTTTIKKTGRGTKKAKSAEKTEIRIRIDAKTKSQAERYFKQYGMTTGDGVRLLLDTMLREKKPLISSDASRTPNAVTRKAIEDAEAGKLKRVTMDDLRRIWDEA